MDSTSGQLPQLLQNGYQSMITKIYGSTGQLKTPEERGKCSNEAVLPDAKLLWTNFLLRIYVYTYLVFNSRKNPA